MKIFCPACTAQLSAENMNVEKDLAVCPSCDEAFSLSEQLAGGEIDDDIDLSHPPAGAWYLDRGFGWSLGASTRSCGAFFLIPFTLVWAGGSLGGIYGSQIVEGKFNLMLSLFGIPFVIGSLVLIATCLMSIWGKQEVTVENNAGTIFTGVAGVGWRRRFRWDEVERVHQVVGNYQSKGPRPRFICLDGENATIKFGSLLSERKRQFLLGGLRTLLRERRD